MPAQQKDMTTLVDELIGTEHAIAVCCQRLARLIKNGRISKKFQNVAQKAKDAEESLANRFNRTASEKYRLEQSCQFCQTKPESFSLLGALNLSTELLSHAMRHYKEAMSRTDKPENTELFKGLLKEKTRQYNLVRKERQVIRLDPDTASFIDTYCLPEVIAKLWT